ncbi:MAG TPA: hypothetical protein VFB35_06985 [Gaiellaceae bacterium]|nr:hypothetical protein [Gaiellaceae bacterium]
MRGYAVMTSDDRDVGQVVDVRNGFLIVESGHLHKSRHPVPREFVHVVDEAAKAFVTIPRRLLFDAPRADKRGNFDREAAARHFGLGESYLQPTEGEGGPAAEHRRAELRKRLRPGYSDEHRHPSTALFGDRRIHDRRVKEG